MKKTLLFTFVLILIWGCSTKNQKSDSQLFNYIKDDQSLVELLIEQGSNANKEHWVSFMVDCKTEKLVTEIISNAKLVGFDDDYISYSDKTKLWSSSLSVLMKLNIAEVTFHRNKLMPLIPEQLCQRVGWGASVES